MCRLGTRPGPLRDQQLRNDLVELHMRVARSIASRFRNRGIDDDDLEQETLLALS